MEAAPFPGVVGELQARVRALGARFDPSVQATTQQIYRPHVDMTPVEEKVDLPYGPRERHRLDLYLPEGAPQAAVAFVHGGGFVGGGKDQDGTFYANVGRFLAREGFAAVLPNYRLAPQHGWPAGAEDVRDAIRWVRQNVPGVSASEIPLFVIGQSAGACHVASWLFDAHVRGEPLGRLAGALLMSGLYRVVAPLSANAAAYFGGDTDLHARRSPLTHVSPIGVPVCLTVAELDPGHMAGQTYALAHALCQCGEPPELAWLRGHNHVSTVMSLGSAQQDAASAILRFLRGHMASHEPEKGGPSC